MALGDNLNQYAITGSNFRFNTQEQTNNIHSISITGQHYTPNVNPFNVRNSETDANLSAQADLNLKRTNIRNQQIANLVGQATKSVSDMMASEAQLASIENAANTNIFMMNYDKSLAVQAGMQASLDRRMEGELAADQAALSLAAQGQNLSGAGAQKVMASYRAIGIENAYREEAKMYAEIAGFDMEIANQKYNVDMARSQNEMAMVSGILGTAGSVAGYYLNN